MPNYRSRLTLLSLFTFLLVFIAQAWAAQPPGGHLNVMQVLVDDPNDPTSITIFGEDLDFGSGPLVVTLGEYVDPPAIIGTPSDTEIVAELPTNIDDGDYLLTVANGDGQSQGDEYDLASLLLYLVRGDENMQRGGRPYRTDQHIQNIVYRCGFHEPLITVDTIRRSPDEKYM